MLHAIVMAGGTGTRFWPASRNEMPKQLLRLVGDATMLRQTLDRLGDAVPNDRRLVVTNERLVVAVRQQLPELPASAVVGEPCKRDTAPCIGLAALLVSRTDPEATMVVMPADHPLAAHRAIRFQDAAAFPFLAQAGPLPRSADIDPDFTRFRASLKPRMTSNSIQALKVAIRLGMGIAYFTRLGFLDEIERGDIVWRPFDSPAINALRIGLVIAEGRTPTAPAHQLTRRLVEELGKLRGT